MRTVGVICECNPPHAGHFHLLDEARRAGECQVICVMSGCFVQRGEPAILDPYARAEMLVRAGADVVVELPFPYSASSAEFFGRAGVEILDRLGVTELWFGSERGELDSLWRLAEAAESEEFKSAYRESASGSGGTARAYFDLLSRFAGADGAASPNDILALSYLRAIRARGSGMKPVTVRRKGSGYSEERLRENEYPSATALRKRWREEGLEAMLPHAPTLTHEILTRECAAGRAPADMERAEALILGTLRMSQPDLLASLAGLSGGLAGRLLHAAEDARSLEELYALAATKKYPDATVRRALLYALLSVSEEDLRAPVAYVRLLSASREGCAYLSARRRDASIPVITRQGEIPTDASSKRQSALETREKALYTLLLPRRATAGDLLRHPPVICAE